MRERIEVTKKDNGHWYGAIYLGEDDRLMTAFDLKPKFSYQNAFNYMKKFLSFPKEYEECVEQDDRSPSGYDDQEWS